MLDNRGRSIRTVFYGELNYILECRLGNQQIWPQQDFRNQTRLLAVITPCNTKGKDATKQVVEYTTSTTRIVTDLLVVQCVVGRVQRGNKWGIIDRSGEQARTEFVMRVSDELCGNAEGDADSDLDEPLALQFDNESY